MIATFAPMGKRRPPRSAPWLNRIAGVIIATAAFAAMPAPAQQDGGELDVGAPEVVEQKSK